MVIIAIAFIDIILFEVSNSAASLDEHWWGSVAGCVCSAIILIIYLCTLYNRVHLSMTNRSFLFLFPAVFLLAVKFMFVTALTEYQGPGLIECRLAFFIGFLMLLEIYLTLRNTEQELLSSFSDLESQRRPIHGQVGAYS
ncbi:hypothetical protein BGX29_002748 [Mortierella sp. GBA35]|nr:hypothetical protein BGX29_002748 [Mortierella sp. GBA35]